MSKKQFTSVLALILATLISNPAKAQDLNFYDIQTKLTNHQAQQISLAHFKGHPVLVTMFYASCPSACPATIAKLKSLLQKLPEDVARNTGVMLISFDPERDTPDLLSKVIKEHELNPKLWQLVAPENKETVDMLAAALTVQFRKNRDGEYGHTSPVAIIDSKGVIRYSDVISKETEANFLSKLQDAQ